MSLITKTDPVGVDKRIDSLQKKLFSELCRTWNIPETKYNCTPRCYRNNAKDGGYTAELFTGGVDYEELYYNDTVSATSFFGVGQVETILPLQNMTQVDVHLIFSVNAQEVKPQPPNQRNDEEIRLDVQRILDSYGAARGWVLTKVTSGLDKILAEYPGSRASEGLKYKDMHPFLWFRFDLQIFLQPTQQQCSS